MKPRGELHRAEPPPGWGNRPFGVVPSLLTFLAVGTAVGLAAGCGAASRSPVSTIAMTGTKVLAMRAVALNDIDTLSTANDAVDVAAAAIGNANAAAPALVSQAADQVALSAPIAARARTDLVSYQHSLSGLTAATTADRDAAAAVRTAAGNVVDVATREVSAIQVTTVDFAAEWPDLGRLSAAQQQWARHRKDPTAQSSAVLTYLGSAGSIDADLAPLRARVAADEVVRTGASRAAAAALTRFVAGLPAGAVLAPSPLPSPSLSLAATPPAAARSAVAPGATHRAAPTATLNAPPSTQSTAAAP